MWLQSHDVVTVENHTARVRPVNAGDEVEEGGLAGPVGADEPQYFPLFGIEGKIVDGLEAAETLGQIFYFKEIHSISPS